MSINVDYVEVLSNTAKIKALHVLRINKDYDGMLPEHCFIDSLKDSALDFVLDSMPDELLDIDEFEWSGKSSGYAYTSLVQDICKFIVGDLEVIFHWDCGDIDGLKISNGVATICNIEYKLVPKAEV